ncbi:hypothetical protein RB200_21575 [Streptomyces sp. PmtG]
MEGAVPDSARADLAEGLRAQTAQEPAGHGGLAEPGPAQDLGGVAQVVPGLGEPVVARDAQVEAVEPVPEVLQAQAVVDLGGHEAAVGPLVGEVAELLALGVLGADDPPVRLLAEGLPVLGAGDAVPVALVVVRGPHAGEVRAAAWFGEREPADDGVVQEVVEDLLLEDVVAARGHVAQEENRHDHGVHAQGQIALGHDLDDLAHLPVALPAAVLARDRG